MKIGIFGGSFNPPHKMHEDMAKFLLDGYVDKIIFVPTGIHYEYHRNTLPGTFAAEAARTGSRRTLQRYRHR